jgi:hypothetical protein
MHHVSDKFAIFASELRQKCPFPSLFAQFLRRTATSKEIIRANLYIIGAAFKRGLLHKCIEAVAGLSEIWQSLRFSYAHKLVPITNENVKK